MVIRILVIFTGGTFATYNNGNTRVIDPSSPQSFLKDIKSKYDEFDNIEFSQYVWQPLIASENLNLNSLNRFVATYKNKINVQALDFHNNQYDGIIVTHGTDTLAYSAAFSSVLLSFLDIPIVFVSSNHPLSNANANGYKNFYSAVRFIKENKRISGVFVAYSYDLVTTEFYNGCDIVQSIPFIDRYMHFDASKLGTLTKKNNFDFSTKGFKASDPTVLDNLKSITKPILLIDPYVGLDYTGYNIDKFIGVLHRTYHSFTVATDTEDDSQSVISLYNRLNKANKPLYFASYSGKVDEYSSIIPSKLKEKGSTMAFVENSSVELAYARLLIGHNIQDESGLLNTRTQRLVGIKLRTHVSSK